MNRTTKQDLYSVIVNHEEQYSISPIDTPLPSGWSRTGKTGSKEECILHIENVWTDMRPLNLRETIENNLKKITR